MGAAGARALATLVVTWALTRPVGAVRLPRRPGGVAVAAGGQPAARPRAGHQRALLPRRHADHLALRALRAGRPLHAGLPHPRVHARARLDLPDHRVPAAVAGRRPRRAARAARSSRARPTRSSCSALPARGGRPRARPAIVEPGRAAPTSPTLPRRWDPARRRRRCRGSTASSASRSWPSAASSRRCGSTSRRSPSTSG